MGADEIGRAVGTLLNRRKVAKHYHHRQRAELHARSCRRRDPPCGRPMLVINQCAKKGFATANT
jgi:hypothetical protein